MRRCQMSPSIRNGTNLCNYMLANFFDSIQFDSIKIEPFDKTRRRRLIKEISGFDRRNEMVWKTSGTHQRNRHCELGRAERSGATLFARCLIKFSALRK